MTTTLGRRRRRTSMVAGALAAVALAGACGDRAPDAAPATVGEALGLDGSDFREREAKVQEAVRRCMEDEGFDYIPMDASAMNVQIRSPGSDDNAEFRRTKGYGITTTFGDRPTSSVEVEGDSDPNQMIREALTEEEQAAYDKALFGAAAGEARRGEFAVRVGPGPGGAVAAEDAGEAPDLFQAGCFGKAQSEVGDNNRLQRVGPRLQEMEERISSDPRMVKANADWAACMADAGFDFDKPEDIVPFLFGKLQALHEDGDDGAQDDPEAPRGITIGGPPPDSPELAALQQEELALAKVDDDCSERTDRRDTAKKVRAEAEKQFLADNPDLGRDAGDGES